MLAWFYRILRHTVADYYRSHGAEARRNEAFLRELTVAGDHHEPPPDEVQATVCACLHRLLPGLHGNYAELIKRIDLDGESPEQVGVRADRVIARMRAASGNVLVFSSGHILRVIGARWLGLPPAGGAYFLLGTASLSALSYEHDLTEPVHRFWNDMHHLTGANE